ncbi:MAG: exonuclease domain-containing protein [Saprospiraceae bacterium]
MQFNLKKNLVFFDVETTGLHIIRDRIIQIALIKYFPGDKPQEELKMLINPGIPISEESMAIHGITPKDLANKPTFREVAQKIFDFIGDADLAGYNSNRFDIPMLMEEFDRAGFDFDISKRNLIDVQRIFYKMEPRTLKAAVQFYCNEEFQEAHDALEDVKATVKVFQGQLEKYKAVDYFDEDKNKIPAPIQNDMRALHEFTNDLRIIDATQRLKYDINGVVVFNFGKYINLPVAETVYKDRNYYHWIIEKEFSIQVKNTVKKLFKEYELSQKK